MIHDRRRADIAQRILLDREARCEFFPSDIFDEYAWNMLLYLFIAAVSQKSMPESELIKLVHTNTNIGQRWLYLLAKDYQVESRVAGDDVVLTTAARSKLSDYLDTVKMHN